MSHTQLSPGEVGSEITAVVPFRSDHTYAFAQKSDTIW
jgi:hypothetical protein